MSIGAITSVASILGSALQSVGLTSNATSGSQSGISFSPQTSDNGQLSPLGQVLSTLQQLQQSNPTEYKQVTQQIATNLTTAAQTAQSAGNTTEANQLTHLAGDFTNASTSGQLPNIQDLAQAVGGGHHHHHHSGSAAATPANSSSTSTNQTQSDALNPLNIINNTLTNAGVTSVSS